MAKFPEPPTVARLRQIEPQLRMLPAGRELWRIYFRGGRYPVRWDAFRAFGPVNSARFDHHDAPQRIQERKTLYAAVDGVTCLAEVFQHLRVIDRSRGEPWLVGFALETDLTLLDLTGTWPTKDRKSTR